MRVLIITNLFPSAARPLFSQFNRQQFAALSRQCEVHVLATIPWFPGRGALGRWLPGDPAKGARAAWRAEAAAPRRETIDGLAVHHPRTAYIPRLPGASGVLHAASLLPAVLPWRGRVDVVLGSWAYPDGCAAIALSRLLGVPAAVKLHGSDLNVNAELPGPRRWLRRLLPRAARVIAVSRALGARAVALGVPADRVEVVYNGVDGALFRVRDRGRDRAEARAALGLPAGGRIILYVGNAIEPKGVVDLARAFERACAAHPDLSLVIVGDGDARGRCDEIARRVGPRMVLAGARPLPEVAAWMAACDVLALPSWNEGTPNVVLEALSSGRRVVATPVGGVPDLIDSDVVGELVPVRDPAALADALVRAAYRDYDPAAVAAAGARGSWDDSAAHLLRVLEAAAATRP